MSTEKVICETSSSNLQPESTGTSPPTSNTTTSRTTRETVDKDLDGAGLQGQLPPSQIRLERL